MSTRVKAIVGALITPMAFQELLDYARLDPTTTTAPPSLLRSLEKTMRLSAILGALEKKSRTAELGDSCLIPMIVSFILVRDALSQHNVSNSKSYNAAEPLYSRLHDLYCQYNALNDAVDVTPQFGQWVEDFLCKLREDSLRIISLLRKAVIIDIFPTFQRNPDSKNSTKGGKHTLRQISSSRKQLRTSAISKKRAYRKRTTRYLGES